ncbi:Alpha-L-rhamnosidase rgxB [Escovopsis weberi]|uniref:Alpha-L-rhamnosidase rgxB n=1 Tax=Escovopsis weberi TaxID=150374 RepID=A0A0M8MUI7_ESCWE|nr:Alpha-L-rhamnosidase rgxB [Escovopsis weberi]
MKNLLSRALAVAAVALPAVSASGPLAYRQPPLKQSLSNAENEMYWKSQAQAEGRRLCFVLPDAEGGDDAPALMQALNHDCRSKGMVVLPGALYHIDSNMTTLDLDDVEIHQFGRLLWSGDLDYWLSVSMPVGFQNQSTVWYFGGDRVNWNGYKTGTMDGNGQLWYDWARSQGNLAHRPMNINFRSLTNSAVRGLRFVQSQMWTMAVSNSQYVDFEDIYVNSTSTSEWSTLNTDGCDTINSDSITFRRWHVINGDDAIALKGNSSNISIYDSVFEDGQGVAIGSLAQYDGRHEYVTDFYARNITLRNCAHVSYIKTWAGISTGYPPNGGGGGYGTARNLTMEDVVVEGGRQEPFYLWQCENYSGLAGQNCDTSAFKVEDVAWRRVSGWATTSVVHVVHFQCSAAAGGCDNMEVTDFNVTTVGTGAPLVKWYCRNVNNPIGFTCNDS